MSRSKMATWNVYELAFGLTQNKAIVFELSKNWFVSVELEGAGL